MLTFLAAACLGALAVAAWRRFARARRWLAQPSARGLHVTPTPSGAGLALFCALALLAAFAPAALAGPYAPALSVAVVLAVVGFVDDLRSLPALPRLALYAGASLLAVAWLLAPAVGGVLLPVLLPLAFAVLAFTNLYNFMDGIDGLASLQAVLAAGFVGAVAAAGGASPAYAFSCLALAGVHAGCLCFNRPPASVFMGDAGSVPTGFLLAVLAVAASWREGLPPALWPILLAAFACDAGMTLLWRSWRGAPLAQAHREHLYQRLARRWNSHGRVDLLFVAVQVLWLTPLAGLVLLRPAWSAVALVAAYAPLLWAMVKLRHLQ